MGRGLTSESDFLVGVRSSSGRIAPIGATSWSTDFCEESNHNLPIAVRLSHQGYLSGSRGLLAIPHINVG